jgi:hypothetical protein
MSSRNFVLMESKGKPYVVMAGPRRYAIVIRRKFKKEWSGHVASVHSSVSAARMAASDMVANGWPRRLLKVYPVTDLSLSAPLRYV